MQRYEMRVACQLQIGLNETDPQARRAAKRSQCIFRRISGRTPMSYGQHPLDFLQDNRAQVSD